MDSLTGFLQRPPLSTEMRRLQEGGEGFNGGGWWKEEENEPQAQESLNWEKAQTQNKKELYGPLIRRGMSVQEAEQDREEALLTQEKGKKNHNLKSCESYVLFEDFQLTFAWNTQPLQITYKDTIRRQREEPGLQQ